MIRHWRITLLVLILGLVPASVIAEGLSNSVPLNVSGGGSGDTSLGANTVLIGQGASPVATVAVGTSGQCLTGNTSAAPTYQPCAAGSATLSTIAPTVVPAATLAAVNTPTSTNTVTPSSGYNAASVTLASGTHTYLLLGWVSCFSTKTTANNCEAGLWDSTNSTFLVGSGAGVAIGSGAVGHAASIPLVYIGSFSSSNVIQMKVFARQAGTTVQSAGASLAAISGASNLIAVQLS